MKKPNLHYAQKVAVQDSQGDLCFEYVSCTGHEYRLYPIADDFTVMHMDGMRQYTAATTEMRRRLKNIFGEAYENALNSHMGDQEQT